MSKILKQNTFKLVYYRILDFFFEGIKTIKQVFFFFFIPTPVLNILSRHLFRVDNIFLELNCPGQ